MHGHTRNDKTQRYCSWGNIKVVSIHKRWQEINSDVLDMCKEDHHMHKWKE